jgi:hypothetical protein
LKLIPTGRQFIDDCAPSQREFTGFTGENPLPDRVDRAMKGYRIDAIALSLACPFFATALRRRGFRR